MLIIEEVKTEPIEDKKIDNFSEMQKVNEVKEEDVPTVESLKIELDTLKQTVIDLIQIIKERRF